ncbi:putative Rho GTPase activating protein 15, partial [Operophtera brumata]
MREVESWIPNAVAVTLLDGRAPQPVVAWLATIRASIEEYDPLVIVTPSPEVSESPDSAFDEILSHLGKEIYQLDQYQSNLAPVEKEVSLSILNIFDECLDQMTEKMLPDENRVGSENKFNMENGWIANFSDDDELPHRLEDKSISECNKLPVVNGFESDSDCEKPESFVTSTPGVRVSDKRTRLSNSTSSSIYDNLTIEDGSPEWTKLIESDSEDSESTCWSYKECSDGETDVNNAYASVWIHSSGFHNSDEILRRVLSKNRATVSRLSFDTASEFTPAEYNVYALQEVGDRYEPPVAAMTPDRPYEDVYEPVKDAITDENIYEEIEYNYSYTDEGCSCGTSVEVESCSISASSEGVGRESPLYQNLRDNDAYAITPDVLFWKNLLLDPYYNDDEEDE